MTDNEQHELKVLSVAEILGADDLSTKEIEVPEWGGVVIVQELTKAEFNDIRARLSGTEDPGPFEQAVFLAGVKEPEFSPEQYQLLLQKSNRAIQRVLNGIQDLSALDDSDEQEAEKKVATFPT